MVNILAIGDVHGNLNYVKSLNYKDVDLILLTGDLGNTDVIREMSLSNKNRVLEGNPVKVYSNTKRKKAYMQTFSSALKILKFLSKKAPTYLVFGNAEDRNKNIKRLSNQLDQELPSLYDEIQKLSNIHALDNKFINFEGIRIGGIDYFTDLNWVKSFTNDDGYLLKKAEAESEKISHILNWYKENNIDILLTHQPPFGYLDKVSNPIAPKHWQNKHAGSKVILDFMKSSKTPYIISGHIHEAAGESKYKNTQILNLGYCKHKLIQIFKK